ncbi:hypothetical protein TWF281_007155 [Arthrobotrys megalospora]
MNGDVVDSPAPKAANASDSTQKNGIFVKNQWMCNCTPRLPGVLKTVRKMGKNEGRQFWSCSKYSGPRVGCGFWLWFEEARDRELISLRVNGQMPTKTVTPSRPFRQTKISDSFLRSKTGESSSGKKPLFSSLGKGKAPVSVRFEDENLEPSKGGSQVDAISILSDGSEDDAEGELSIIFDEDIELFEEALEEPAQDNNNISVPANGNLGPNVNRQLQDDEPSEDGPRKIARTENNTSPSKHLLPEQAKMSAPQSSFEPPSTGDTVADTPSTYLQGLDIRSTATREQFARQEEYNNVDPVAFPDLRPYLNQNKNKKPINLPPASTSGSSSVPTFVVQSTESANPLGPRTGALSNSVQSFNRPQPLTEHSLPNGVPFPATPNHKYAGIPGTPSSRTADDVVDVTDEVFGILKKAGVRLQPSYVADITKSRPTAPKTRAEPESDHKFAHTILPSTHTILDPADSMPKAERATSPILPERRNRETEKRKRST